MKRIICVISVLMFMLCGCVPTVTEKPSVNEAVAKSDFSKGVWLSFNEINSFIKSADGFKTSFEKAIADFKDFGITDLYFHVRSHCDSVVSSDFFPQTETSKALDFDILEYVTDICHKESIKVHAWINPYRVNATTEDTSALDENNTVKKWAEENSLNVIKYNGIYLNPSSGDARKLVLDGVGEILVNYDVDGIHFDDYFYPTADPEFDKESFEAYKTDAKNPLPLADWRRANVDILIADCKALIGKFNKDITFSISPAASIDKNYNSYFADIGGWVKNGYIDEIIPQLYFGFNHPDENFRFEKLLKDWKNLCNGSEVVLKIGLAPYKIGYNTVSDGDEWEQNDNILARQAKLCLNDSLVSGAVFFSHTHLFSVKKQNTAERNNLKAVFQS